MRTVRETSQTNPWRSCDRGLGAPRSVIELPLVIGIAPLVRRNECAPFERSSGSDSEFRAGGIGCAKRLAIDKEPSRIQPAFVKSANAGPTRRRIGLRR